MQFNAEALDKLRKICAASSQVNLSDSELEDIGRRIILFIKNTDEDLPARVVDGE